MVKNGVRLFNNEFGMTMTTLAAVALVMAAAMLGSAQAMPFQGEGGEQMWVYYEYCIVPAIFPHSIYPLVQEAKSLVV